MCIAPNVLANGTITACHKCWQCIEQAVNDWVGRNIAESKTSIESHCVTLTYGRDDGGRVDHARSAILTYSDVKNMLKKLRNHGLPVRYFITGEYGSKKGRAHWHAVLHWKERVPEFTRANRFMFPHWEHGHTNWKSATAPMIRYNCKYILKDYADGAGQTSLPRMSKKPPLGHDYFCQLAERYVDNGLSPQDLSYRFRGVNRRTKAGNFEEIDFRLRDVSADNFLNHFVRTWEQRRPGEVIPPSEAIYNWLTPELKEERGITARHKDMPVGNARTVAQSLQIRKDADRMAKLREGRERDAQWATPTMEARRERPSEPWLGPRNMDEWNADYQYWEEHGQVIKQQKRERGQQLVKIERAASQLIGEEHLRQGLGYKITNEDGSVDYLSESEAIQRGFKSASKGYTKRPKRGGVS